ncbi:hypothetical protein HF086_000347 [Spodoptera exigua]|uniref:STPR domain-containing protein n=1 Tax=Spodoptera exigua TaxID=7107 RepID=A0A922SCK0_SPOEX|nr:hypothetical protein HF086_000347 [Spodoptera exigua]
MQDRLANETEEQRDHRFRLISDRLSNETEEQRTHRLSLISDRLSNETQEQRAHRLGLIHDRLNNETEEQRTRRLGLMQDRLANETEEQRAHRFRLISNRLSNETDEQRAHRLRLISDRLSNETEEQRAHRLGLIHDRLSNETPEARLNRLNTMRQTSHIRRAEQLPLTPHQAGLILVVESLEDLSSSKEFVVDTQRLNKALTSLISNNHLYRDVRAYFESSANITPLVQIVEYYIQEDGTEETSSNQYVIINDNKAILRGSFHQGDLRFNSSRGKQCTGIAAVACVAFTVLDPNNWSKSDIDKYYNDCIASRNNPAFGEMNPDYLAVTDLMPSLVYNRQNIAIKVLEETNINSHLDNDNSSDGFPNLRNALRSFFTEYSSGILTTNAITVAVHYRTSYYYLFDSHARGAKGSSAPINGAACCMRFTDLNDLHTVLRRNLFVSPNKPPGGNLRDNLNVYSLTPLVVAVDNQMRSFRPISEQSAIEMMESPTFIPSPINLLQPPIQVIESVEKTLQSALAQGSEIQLPITAHNSLNTIYIESTSILQNIDDNVPNLENVVGVNTSLTDDTMRLAAITRKTAPPLNLERERRMEELCWYFIYPDGKNGFGEERENPVSPLDYFQNRIMSNERRFN